MSSYAYFIRILISGIYRQISRIQAVYPRLLLYFFCFYAHLVQIHQPQQQLTPKGVVMPIWIRYSYLLYISKTAEYKSFILVRCCISFAFMPIWFSYETTTKRMSKRKRNTPTIRITSRIIGINQARRKHISISNGHIHKFIKLQLIV